MVKEQMPLLLFRQTSEVGLKCSIDLSKLFPDEKSRYKFQNNFKKFCEAQPTVCNIIQVSGKRPNIPKRTTDPFKKG